MTNEAGVESTLTRVVTREIKKGLLIEPSCWKKMVRSSGMKVLVEE